MKKLSSLALTLIFLVTMLSGCSPAPAPNSDKVVNGFNVDDIKVCTELAINDDGKRSIMFWFENNSSFTVTYVKVRYVVKDGLTKEDIQANHDYIGTEEKIGLDADYTVSDVFMAGELGLEHEYYEAFGEDYPSIVSVASGESSPKVDLMQNNIFYVREQAAFDDFTPDVMTIQYNDADGNSHTIYYDFVTQKANAGTDE